MNPRTQPANCRARHARTWAWLAAFGFALLVSRSAAAAPTARLSYVRGPGAESCVDEAGLRSAVAARLGYDPFRPFADVTVSLVVERARGHFEAHMRLADKEGKERGARDLRSRADDCRDLTDSMALTVSIALDPTSLTRPPEPKEPDPPPPPKDPDPPPPPKDPDPPPPPPKDPDPPRTNSQRPADEHAPRLSAHAAFGGALGAAPTLAPSFMLRGALRVRSFEAQLGGLADLAVSEPTSQGGTLRASFLTGQASPCAVFAPLVVCGVLQVGSLRVESLGVSSPRTQHTLIANAGASLGVRIAITRLFAVEGHVTATLLLTPSRFAINGVQVFELAPVAVRAGVGPTLIF
jgi:hypothetical protein